MSSSYIKNALESLVACD